MRAAGIEGKSRTVFVGNIPYDATEEELRNVFTRVGQVESFRLVFDKDTKQPKGYGFCDYAEPDMATAAVKSLSDVEFSGRRLRIDLTDINMRLGGKGMGPPLLSGRPGGPLALPAPGPSPQLALPAPHSSSSAPATTSLPPNMIPLRDPRGPPPQDPALVAKQIAEAHERSAHTEIAQTVSAMPKAQMQICLGAMQRLAQEAPESARNMLQDHPQLCYALLHAQLLTGLSQDPSAPPDQEELQVLRAQAKAAQRMAPYPGTGPGVLPVPRAHAPPRSIIPPIVPMGAPPPQASSGTSAVAAAAGLLAKAAPPLGRSPTLPMN